MKKIFTAIAMTALLFVIGIIAYHYASNALRGKSHQVSGVVQYHTPDYTVSADAPEGYYVESTAIGRVYIEHKNVFSYVNKYVIARGYLEEICGNDGGSCFPLVDAQSITITK